MQLRYYPKIQPVNDVLMHRFRNHPQTNNVDYVVTEFVDGDHMALYSDWKNKEFKVASRNRFINEDDSFSASKEIVSLYRDWAMKLSAQQDCPIVVYGKAVGGNFQKVSKGVRINTVCEYMELNEFIIHDIRTSAGWLSIVHLQELANKSLLQIAPVLFKGPYAKACCYPEDGLSAIPFMDKLQGSDLKQINFNNEMKGIVIRPAFDLNSGIDRVIMKKINRKYAGRKDQLRLPAPHDAPYLQAISEFLYNEAVRIAILDAVLTSVGGEYSYSEVNKLAGKCVILTLDKINYFKYNLLTKEEKHSVNKALNELFEEEIRKLIRLGNVA